MKIAVIGGGGKMGQWLCRYLGGEGFDIIIADNDKEKLKEAGKATGAEIAKDSREAAGKADVVIISVPINNFEKVIKEIGPAIRPEQIVIDVTSVKAAPVKAMHEHIKTGLILGAHPLFGPGVKSLKDQNFVLTPTNDKEKALAVKVEQFLTKRGACVNLMTPVGHDEMMAVVQGLSHFVAIVSADALAGLGELGEMKDVSTTTFRIFLNYIESVIGDDAPLYAAIQMEHPEMGEIYQKLTRSVEKFAGYVRDKDTQGFVGRMKELKKYLGK
jgi:prephenate dehydrogenase